MESSSPVKKDQKLRYSRQIKTYGRDMQQRLMEMKYLIYGMRGLGAEVAKHLILNGVKEVHICDPKPAEIRDLAANYFMREDNIKDNISRADASVDALKILNNQVGVKVIPELSITQILESQYNGVIITEAYGLDWSDSLDKPNNIYRINYDLREHKIGLILSEALGQYSYIFNDFGEGYKVLSTGIEEEQLPIKDMTFEDECIITTKYACRDEFKENDIVEFLNLEGNRGLHMLNEKEFRILEIIGSNKIKINCDTSKYCDMRPGAKLSLKKRGETLNFFPLKEELSNLTLQWSCGQKKHLLFAKLLLEYRRRFEKSVDITLEDADELFSLATSTEFREIFEAEFGTEFDTEVTKEIVKKFVRTLHCELITVTSIFGGIVAAEALKMTGKYTPIEQWYAYDQVKYIPDISGLDEVVDQRYADNIAIFGSEIQENLHKLKVFLPGVGAIGCEVLK